ncbi:hypothetical protein R8Z57_04965 [Microbacterium sp. M3]|uniref:Uncharacterized protein n=1 Tax=Microbacterium arthrosphaerae TaxID=792652 RepID=A0ABU4GYG7_9MICO|nr:MULTISPECIES: hypothetical protein [Microbacterium]MDW4572127.1 hypothetical protein [Microbacterium arthrosphaerae]MDW7605982.1 hypothetical protein [Microbacterium sp. M3]
MNGDDLLAAGIRLETVLDDVVDSLDDSAADVRSAVCRAIEARRGASPKVTAAALAVIAGTQSALDAIVAADERMAADASAAYGTRRYELV